MPLGVLGSLFGGHCQIPPRLPFKEGLAPTAAGRGQLSAPQASAAKSCPLPAAHLQFQPSTSGPGETYRDQRQLDSNWAPLAAEPCRVRQGYHGPARQPALRLCSHQLPRSHPNPGGPPH